MAELVAQPAELIASVWIMDRIPHIFADDIRAFARWRQTLASGLGVDPSSVLITGSAAFGVSLNPYKNYKYFDDSSDIDVAVISGYHFTEGWRSLRSIGAKRHGLSQVTKQSLDDHVTKYIYWGTIATDKILALLPYGKPWAAALEEMRNISPTNGRKIKARVYSDLQSLRAYQVHNLKNLKNEELSKGLS